METKKFFKELVRMCNFHRQNGGCGGCEIMKTFSGCPVYMERLRRDFDFDKLINIVQTWAKEHPRKTRAMDFFEKHPNAPKGDGEAPVVCAYNCGYRKNNCKLDDGSNCKDCWNEPLEEE